MSKVGVVGAGYVGLTTAACLAHLGHDVICGDADAEKVEQLKEGKVSIHEDGLSSLVSEGLAARRLQFIVGASDAARDVEYVFLCVNTPQAADGSADLSALREAVRQVAPALSQGTIVVNKSTAPVGTVARMAGWLSEAGVRSAVAVASNPEFLQEGTAVRDFLQPHRIVIGADDPEVAGRVASLYDALQAPVVVTDPASAEMSKYASNAFLAMKISFINAVANICEAVDADVRDVARGMGYDPRIGPQYLDAGPGWGGPCLPKDAMALVRIASDSKYDFDLLRTAIEVNARQRDQIVAKVRDARGGSLVDARVAVWGLAFKAGTDDLRDSAAVDITRRIIAEGATVAAFDPVAGEAALALGLPVVPDPYEACAGAHVLAVLTEWDELRQLDLGRALDLLASPELVDARNLFDPVEMRRIGFSYRGVGC